MEIYGVALRYNKNLKSPYQFQENYTKKSSATLSICRKSVYHCTGLLKFEIIYLFKNRIQKLQEHFSKFNDC